MPFAALIADNVINLCRPTARDSLRHLGSTSATDAPGAAADETAAAAPLPDQPRCYGARVTEDGADAKTAAADSAGGERAPLAQRELARGAVDHLQADVVGARGAVLVDAGVDRVLVAPHDDGVD